MRLSAKLAITGCGQLASNKSPESPLISLVDLNCIIWAPHFGPLHASKGAYHLMEGIRRKLLLFSQLDWMSWSPPYPLRRHLIDFDFLVLRLPYLRLSYHFISERKNSQHFNNLIRSGQGGEPPSLRQADQTKYFFSGAFPHKIGKVLCGTFPHIFIHGLIFVVLVG